MAKKYYQSPQAQVSRVSEDIVTASGQDGELTYGSFDVDWIFGE